MSGVTLEYDASSVVAKLNAMADVLADPRLMFLDMGEHLLHTTQKRFDTQTGPDGSAWEALKPAYQRRKKKNKDRILVLEGYLKNLLRYQATSEELLLGSDRIYAAIQHFGGVINIAARSQEAFFRRNKNGEVGNRFVKKRSSNFAQRVTLGPYTITIPSRKFLGISADDESALLEIATDHLERPLN